jgi:hypothetical protein
MTTRDVLKVLSGDIARIKCSVKKEVWKEKEQMLPSRKSYFRS